MTANSNNSIVEAYKSIIDFNKTIITIASSVLTAIIAFIVYQNIELRWTHYLTLALIVVSIFFSLFGFGYAIQTVKDGVSRNLTILFTNIGAFVLIIGIGFILTFSSKKHKSIDLMLKQIEESTLTIKKKLTPEHVKSIVIKDSDYIINYQSDSLNTQVIYSGKSEMILSIK